jgi:hypothetical protein
MTRAKKSFRLELTKEQQALILQSTGMEAKELGTWYCYLGETCKVQPLSE